MSTTVKKRWTLFGVATGAGATLALVVVLGVLAGAGTAASTDAPVNTNPPTIAGTVQEGQQLTGDRGSWSGSPTSYEYQWRRCDKRGNNCSGISGAQGTTYTLVANDVGHTIRLNVKAKNADGKTNETSAATDLVTAAASLPYATTPPTISGTPQQGQTLSGDRGKWSTNPSDYNYHWLRCDTNGSNCSKISGANNATYILGSPDVNHTIRFRVDATNAAGTTTAYSVPTAVIAAGRLPANTSPPTISGTPQEGNTLSADRGKWTGSPSDYNDYWLRCDTNGGKCSGIKGAHNKNAYRLTAADVGYTIRFQTGAQNAAGRTFASSAPTAVVTPAPNRPRNTSSPTISGTPAVGQVLTLTVGAWNGTQISYRYQWYRCDRNGGHCVAIHGAFGLTWRVLPASAGHTIRAVVTATNAGGTAQATSVPTPVITAAARPLPPPPPPTATGCPSGSGPLEVTGVGKPARLLIDGQQASPSVVHRGTQQLTVYYHVSACGGRPVHGALVYATAVPFNQLNIPAEQKTDRDGWARLDFRMLAGFPVSSRQQLIALFVRARKPGENILGGISTRRLFSVAVKLNG